jgi:hypothetical protein
MTDNDPTADATPAVEQPAPQPPAPDPSPPPAEPPSDFGQQVAQRSLPPEVIHTTERKDESTR